MEWKLITHLDEQGKVVGYRVYDTSFTHNSWETTDYKLAEAFLLTMQEMTK